MVHHTVDNPVILEVHRKITVVPACNGRDSDGGMFLVGKAKVFEDRALRVAASGQRQLGLALLTDGDADRLGNGRDTTGNGQKRTQ